MTFLAPLFEGLELFPCPTCGALRDIKLTIRRKPYLVCDPCSVQLFVRGAVGIEKMRAISNSPDFLKQLSLLRRFDSGLAVQIKSQISLLESAIGRIETLEILNPLLGDQSARKNTLKSKLMELEGEFELLILTGEFSAETPKIEV
ncbi:MAG: hypothetical protein K2X47_11700 [Bdellovibrionales bacterium]|nr:hypothetical protein [Bdellovibrionales bacterium]